MMKVLAIAFTMSDIKSCQNYLLSRWAGTELTVPIKISRAIRFAWDINIKNPVTVGDVLSTVANEYSLFYTSLLRTIANSNKHSSCDTYSCQLSMPCGELSCKMWDAFQKDVQYTLDHADDLPPPEEICDTQQDSSSPVEESLPATSHTCICDNASNESTQDGQTFAVPLDNEG